MKSRIARIILGILCVIGAFWPGAIAVVLCVHVIYPGLTNGSNPATFSGVRVGGWDFDSNQVPYLAGACGLGAAALFLGGLFLIFFWPREDSRRDPRTD
jgi:hypothetical protein